MTYLPLTGEAEPVPTAATGTTVDGTGTTAAAEETGATTGTEAAGDEAPAGAAAEGDTVT